jgi:large subunit ribosomal protein L18
MCVVKSNRHIQVQVIDDDAGLTLCSASTLSKGLKDTDFNKKNKESAAKIGAMIAEAALKKNIREVIFDRGPYKYHGILAELANAARNAGLKF